MYEPSSPKIASEMPSTEVTHPWLTEKKIANFIKLRLRPAAIGAAGVPGGGSIGVSI